MRKVIRLPARNVVPDRGPVLRSQGIPVGAGISKRVERLLEEAYALYEDLAEPVGLLGTIDAGRFRTVLEGEGNEDEAPLADIYPKARKLALYVVTLGQPVCDRIDRLIDTGDFAAGSLLDSVASAAADRAAGLMEERFDGYLRAQGEASAGTKTLGYSPGYCGWHVSAQARLFAALGPEEIGVTLGGSFLMRPLKSVSGVLVFGEASIHRFDPKFRFCGDCRDHPCRERLGGLSS